MSDPGSKGNMPQWQGDFSNNWSAGQESEDAVAPSKPDTTPEKDDDLGVSELPVCSSVPNVSSSEDMFVWLGYHGDHPLEQDLEESFNSTGFFDQLRFGNSTMLLDPGQSAGGSSSLRASPPLNAGNSGSLNRAAAADAAMALGAGRAAGLVPQTGVEAFSKVRTTMQPPKRPPPANSTSGNSLSGGATPPNPGTRTLQPSTLFPPKPLVPSSRPPRSEPMNFPQFSRTAAKYKANLVRLEMARGGGAPNRLKTPLNGSTIVDASGYSGFSIAESTTTRQQSEASGKLVESSEAQQQSLGSGSNWPMQNSLSTKDAEAAANSALDFVNSETMPVDQSDNCRNSTSMANGAGTDSVKHVSQGGDAQEAPEPAITTSSGNCAETGKESRSSGKRRAREGEEPECLSEDGEEEVPKLKKPQQRASTAKRSRAAEVHNLSERRRRDRINEKMKQLQELIPNSNKTDKASMLDEAIDYLKKLQLQIQMMSMRNGMSMPQSMVMPPAMQQYQMAPPMGPMPPMGMGPMGGMGMGMMDPGGAMAHGRPSHMMPLPPPLRGLGGPGPSYSLSATSPAVSMVDANDHHLQTNSVMESRNVYFGGQRQLQLSAQPMNMDVYHHAYMIHQCQRQRQPQHHSPQQQHQLHISHNMSGGAAQ